MEEYYRNYVNEFSLKLGYNRSISSLLLYHKDTYIKI